MSKLLGAIIRASLIGILFIFPSVIVAGGMGNIDLFVFAFALLAMSMIFVEYIVESPAILEFRYAPPYNRIRYLMLLVLSLIILSSFAKGDLDGGGIYLDALVPSFDFLFSGNYSPVSFLLNALTGEGVSYEGRFSKTLTTVFGIGVLGSLIFGLYIWISPWPLSDDGFNLWPNMPSFNSRVGRPAHIKILQVALLSLALALTMPYIVAMFVNYGRAALGFDFVSSKLVIYWVVFIWVMLPSMAFLRAVALMKLAFLAVNMHGLSKA